MKVFTVIGLVILCSIMIFLVLKKEQWWLASFLRKAQKAKTEDQLQMVYCQSPDGSPAKKLALEKLKTLWRAEAL